MANEAKGGIIIGATIAFAAFAWRAGAPDAAPRLDVECSEMSVVHYVAIPEPAPLVKPPELFWPIADRRRDDQEIAAPVVARDDEPADEAPHRRGRHHRRRR
jgi:hypothetical protein